MSPGSTVRAHRDQDDQSRRAARRHRRNHLPLVRPGMNVIVNDSTKWVPLIILLLIMLAISLTPVALGSQTGLVVISRLGVA